VPLTGRVSTVADNTPDGRRYEVCISDIVGSVGGIVFGEVSFRPTPPLRQLSSSSFNPHPLFLSLSLKSSRNMGCVNLSTWVQTCSMFSKQADLDPRLSKIYPFRSYPQNDDDPSHLSPSMRCSPSWTLLEKKRNQNQRQRTFNFKTYMLQKANSVNQALDAPNRL
jgi:hypothetical protein